MRLKGFIGLQSSSEVLPLCQRIVWVISCLFWASGHFPISLQTVRRTVLSVSQFYSEKTNWIMRHEGKEAVRGFPALSFYCAPVSRRVFWAKDCIETKCWGFRKKQEWTVGETEDLEVFHYCSSPTKLFWIFPLIPSWRPEQAVEPAAHLATDFI